MKQICLGRTNVLLFVLFNDNAMTSFATGAKVHLGLGYSSMSCSGRLSFALILFNSFCAFVFFFLLHCCSVTLLPIASCTAQLNPHRYCFLADLILHSQSN